MAAQQLLGRMLSIQSGVPYILVKEERATPQQLAQVGRAMGEIAEANIWIDETPGLSTLEMRSRVRQLRRTKQVDLIIVDHLQLVGGHERDTPVAKMGKISGAMKGLARELNVPVVALSQLSRAVDNRSDKRPILVDLRESGSLEQDADNVLFIYRESYYDKAALSQDRADVIIAKQRNGETGMVSFYWDAPSTRFYDLGRYLDQAREIDAARAGGG
jgi:replicative DNA helicase